MKSKFTSEETRLSAYNEPKIGQVENAIACKSRRADQPHLAKGLGPGTPSAPLTSFDLWQHKQTLCQWSAVKRLLKCKTLDASPADCKSLAAFRPTDSLRRVTHSRKDLRPDWRGMLRWIQVYPAASFMWWHPFGCVATNSSVAAGNY